MDVKTNSIDQEPLPPDLKWPRLRWRTHLWLLDLISFLLALIVLFWPGLVQEELKYIRFLVGIPLLLVPPLAPVLGWLWSAVGMIRRRVHYYPILRLRAQWAIDELDEMSRNLFYIVQAINHGPIFEIARAAYQQGKLYIALNKRKSAKLVEGDTLLVVHRGDARAMGLFEVTDVCDREYYAIGASNIDPLWLGYVQQQGEVTIVPHIAAIHLPQGETK